MEGSAGEVIVVDTFHRRSDATHGPVLGRLGHRIPHVTDSCFEKSAPNLQTRPASVVVAGEGRGRNVYRHCLHHEFDDLGVLLFLQSTQRVFAPRAIGPAVMIEKSLTKPSQAEAEELPSIVTVTRQAHSELLSDLVRKVPSLPQPFTYSSAELDERLPKSSAMMAATITTPLI